MERQQDPQVENIFQKTWQAMGDYEKTRVDKLVEHMKLCLADAKKKKQGSFLNPYFKLDLQLTKHEMKYLKSKIKPLRAFQYLDGVEWYLRLQV